MRELDAALTDPGILLEIHAEGPVTQGGRLPLAELARIAGGLQLTLERLALALTGGHVGPGPRPRDVVEAVRLDFAGYRSGSAILDIVRPDHAETGELLSGSLRALETGISAIRRGDRLPTAFTPQVVNGLRELAGGVNSGSLTRVSFGLPGGGGFVIDSAFRDALRVVTRQSATEAEATVVGRLQMGDFSPATLRCRIDTFAGSVLADFDADLRNAVLDAMDQIVMAIGTAELQPDGTTVRLLHLSAIETLPSAPMSPLAALARQQGVRPVSDIEELLGPETEDDFGPFLEAISPARHNGGG